MELLESRIAPATLDFGVQVAQDASQFNFLSVDAAGNSFVVGKFRPDIDLDPGPGVTRLTTQDPLGDLYVVKLSPTGSLLWATKWGGTGNEAVDATWADANGDLYLAAAFDSTSGVGFGGTGTLTSTGGIDVAILKFNGADGTPAAGFGTGGQFKFGGTGLERTTGLTTDHAGHLLVSGIFDSSDAGFNGSGSFAATGQDIFVLRVDAATGAPDTSFSGTGAALIDTSSSAVQSYLRTDSLNNVFLGVGDAAIGGWQAFKLKASDGSLDAGFGTAGALSLPATDVNTAFFALAVDHQDRLVIAQKQSGLTALSRYSTVDGTADPTFTGLTPQSPAPGSFISLQIDSHDNIYVAGNTPFTAGNPKNFVYRFDTQGVFSDALLFGRPHDPAFVAYSMAFALDGQDHGVVRATYAAGGDLDPTNGVLKLKVRGDVLASVNMVEGYVARYDPYGIDKANPLNFSDADGDPVTVTLSGAGKARYQLEGGKLSGANLDTLQLSGTDATSQLKIAINTSPFNSSSVNSIVTTEPAESMGSVTLGPFIELGTATTPGTLTITGKTGSLNLAQIAASSVISLGHDLAYLDTYTNRPNLTIGSVLGAGVQINVLGDGTPAGIGGGGLGKVTIGAWSDPGFIRTTQSVGDLTVLNGDFQITLEVDKFGVGEFTTASLGNFTISSGNWRGTGDVEGAIKSFTAEAFLAGATLDAASIGSLKITTGAFDGTVTLTDPDAAAVPTFTVGTDFTGHVVSASTIKKLVIRGAFAGSLEAPSIGAITANAFSGTPGDSHIQATKGALGTITAKTGTVHDFDFVTSTSFSGIKVNLKNLRQDTSGIDNVHITAQSIGNLSVTLAAAAGSDNVNLTGINHSSFTTTGTGTTKGKTGNIGNVTVKLTGAAGGGAATGLQDVNFDSAVAAGVGPASTVNKLGNITVTLAGQDGASIGLKNASFEADTIGKTKVTVSRSQAMAATAQDVQGATYRATSGIGALTFAGDATASQVSGLQVWAGGSVAGLSVSAKTAALGVLANSAILAGQSLDVSGATARLVSAALSHAGLGAVSISGALTASQLVAGASIGAVTVGGAATGSLILAGAKLGGDFLLDGDETYQRAASIAAVTVKGDFTTTSIVAGVSAGADHIFGNADDSLAAVAGVLTAASSQVGAIKLTGVAAIPAASSGEHQFAIQAALLKSLQTATGSAVTQFPAPLFLDAGTAGEDTSDVVIRLISA